MGGLLVALALAAAPPAAPPDDLSRRILDSAAAAQALQGPLDGTWRLALGAGLAILILQVTDHGGDGPLSAAWREPDGPEAPMGLVDRAERSGDRLVIEVPAGDGRPALRLRLRRLGPGLWRGWLDSAGRRQTVRLEKLP